MKSFLLHKAFVRLWFLRLALTVRSSYTKRSWGHKGMTDLQTNVLYLHEILWSPSPPTNYPLPCHIPRHLIFATRSPRTSTSDLHYTSLPRLDSRVWNEDRVLIRKLKHFIAFGLWRHPRLLHSEEGNIPFRGKRRGLPQQETCSPTPWRTEESKCITCIVDS